MRVRFRPRFSKPFVNLFLALVSFFDGSPVQLCVLQSSLLQFPPKSGDICSSTSLVGGLVNFTFSDRTILCCLFFFLTSHVTLVIGIVVVVSGSRNQFLISPENLIIVSELSFCSFLYILETLLQQNKQKYLLFCIWKYSLGFLSSPEVFTWSLGLFCLVQNVFWVCSSGMTNFVQSFIGLIQWCLGAGTNFYSYGRNFIFCPDQFFR